MYSPVSSIGSFPNFQVPSLLIFLLVIKILDFLGLNFRFHLLAKAFEIFKSSCNSSGDSAIYGFWLPLWYLVAIVLSVLLRFTDSGYPFSILWPLCCLSFFYLRILVTPLVSCGHCVVCPSSIYGFWLPLWYLQTIL